MSLPRYDYGRIGMEPHRNGDFVRFNDHDDALRLVNEELRATISEMEIVQARLLAERDEARSEICLLRASMTQATDAVGLEMSAYAESRGWIDLFPTSNEAR